MKDLLSKFKPILKKEGVFYSPPNQKGIKCTIILEEVKREARFSDDFLNNQGKVLGFNAWHKLTGEHYYIESLVSKKIGKPGIYTVIQVANENEPVDYANTLDSALYKAHEYIFNKILEEVLNPDEVYVNLLDKTKIGLEKFNKNQANLSALNLNNEKTYMEWNPETKLQVDKSKATRKFNIRETQFTKNSRLNH
jgi:hypothetical protein